MNTLLVRSISLGVKSTVGHSDAGMQCSAATWKIERHVTQHMQHNSTVEPRLMDTPE